MALTDKTNKFFVLIDKVALYEHGMTDCVQAVMVWQDHFALLLGNTVISIQLSEHAKTISQDGGLRVFSY